jgi:streptogramin lyase
VATAALSVWAGDAVAASLGQITEFSTLQGRAGYLTRIAAGPDGNLWFTDTGSPKPAIGRITRTGVITEFSVPVKLSFAIVKA